MPNLDRRMCNIFYLGILVGFRKREITMATLTKKDLLEAIEDMPMDAEIWISQRTMEDYEEADVIDCDKESNVILIC